MYLEFSLGIGERWAEIKKKMGKKWAPKNGAHLFILKKMGAIENKKRWAKDGLLKMQNLHSIKSKTKCFQESKFPCQSPFGVREKKKRWAIDGQRAHQIKMKKMGVPKNKKRWGNAHLF